MSAAVRTLDIAHQSGHGALYHPYTHEVYAFNFGSHKIADVAYINVNANGSETIESFLARGGQITKGAPKVAKGATLVRTVRVHATRVRTSRG